MVSLTKRWVPLLAALGLTFLLTACNGETGSDTAPVATVPPSQTGQPAAPAPPRPTAAPPPSPAIQRDQPAPTQPVQPTATSLPAIPTAAPLPPTPTIPPTATAAVTLPPTTTPRPTATALPPTPPPPTETPAPIALTIVAYAVPPGSRPHDVAPAPDGRVWYTAQGSGELGVLDPATGNTHHIPLGSGSAPHGVIVGPDGAPWITDGGLNAIVRVGPNLRTGAALPLTGRNRIRQPQHRHVRPAGTAVVHRPKRGLRAPPPRIPGS